MEKKIGFLTGLFLMIALAIAMALVATLVSGGEMTFKNIAITALSAFVINFIASLIIPANRIGAALCNKLNLKEGTPGNHCLTTLVTTFIYVTIVSFGMTVLNVGFTSILFMAWISLFPVLFGAGFIVALILGPFAFKLSKRILGA